MLIKVISLRKAPIETERDRIPVKPNSARTEYPDLYGRPEPIAIDRDSDYGDCTN